jgi:hypothetical protein
MEGMLERRSTTQDCTWVRNTLKGDTAMWGHRQTDLLNAEQCCGEPHEFVCSSSGHVEANGMFLLLPTSENYILVTTGS